MRRLTLASAVAAVALGFASVAVAEEPAATPAQPAEQTTEAAPAAADATASASTSTYTDAQLQSFAAASVEIEAVQAQARAAGGPNEQTQTATRDILARHSLDAQTYNGIVAAAQADQALAQRVVAFRTNATTATN